MHALVPPSGKSSSDAGVQAEHEQVVLGAGGRLFGETQDKIPLRLVESRPLGGGVVSMIYAPVRRASDADSRVEISESGGGGTKRFRPVPTLGALAHHLEKVAQSLAVDVDLDVVAQ
jgi:hypothetical protein